MAYEAADDGDAVGDEFPGGRVRIYEKFERGRAGARTHHDGSAIPMAASSEPRPVPSGVPLLGRVNLQGLTRETMDKTLEKGPMVAAMSGTAVEANHHL